MKLSDFTIEVLRNFSSINEGLVFRPGKKLKTIASGNGLVAEAEIEEDFPFEFGIYDLNKTLAFLSMNPKTQGTPEVLIEKEYLTFVSLGGKGKIRQRFSPPAMIIGYQNLDKKLKIDYQYQFKISEEINKWIFSTAYILKCPNIVVKSSGNDGIYLFAESVNGQIVDDASVKVSDEITPAFSGAFKIESLKIMPGGYNVDISNHGVAKFSHENGKLQYLITMDTTSSF